MSAHKTYTAGFKVDRPIVLIGLMGSGKSSLGRRLAVRLGLPFFDADHEIEAAAGRTISEIFEKFGEAHFRDGERRVIARLIDRSEAHTSELQSLMRTSCAFSS